MNFTELLRRADLNCLQTYLIFGGEDLEPQTQKSYNERLETAQKNIFEFFENRYADIDEYDKMIGYIFEQTEIYREVYFEIGLIAGAKIAYQLRDRMAQIDSGQVKA